MFLLFGFRRKLAELALVQLACRNGHVAAHRIVRLTSWFTLFFIPVIPYSRRYLSVCSMCGLQLRIERSEAEEMAARAGTAHGPVADPVAPPVPYGDPSAVSAPVVPLSPGPPAGWYPDPSGAYQRRFWDGARWTEAVDSPN